MERKAWYTEQVKSGKRTFYFDIRKTEKGASFLSVTVVKKLEEDNYERSQLIVFENEVEKFGEAFLRAMVNFRKTGREAMIEEARKKYPKAYTPWTKADEQQLEVMYAEEQPIAALAQHFQRNEAAIRARIAKLELDEKYLVGERA
ncbi:MAG: DUF3276 family protein [Bacteroidota bacterium]